MENQEDMLKKRIDKFINWIKDPYNFTFVAILLGAIIFRLYYFILTKNQPLWWDEADYMNIARRFAFGMDYTFGAVRPILFSFITAIFLKIANNEFLPRLFISILSVVSIIGVYLLGSKIYNKKVGLIAAFLTSIFYLGLFFSTRMIVDIPSLAFFTLSVYYFYRYFEENSPKYIYIAAVMIAIGTLFKQSTAFMLLGILIYVLITEKLSFIKKKEYWIAGIIFFLILSPYIIWGYKEYNAFVLIKGPGEVAPTNYLTRSLQGARDYIYLFPTYFFSIGPQNVLLWLTSLVFIFGLMIIYFLKLFLGFDILLKKDDMKLKKDLFVFLMILIPFLLAVILINHNEDRYIINPIVILFLVFGYFLTNLYEYLKKKNKIIAILVLAGLLLYIGYIQYKATDSLIKNKLPSYAEIKEAGLWMKANSNEDDVIVSSSPMQIQYYSDRKTYEVPQLKETFENTTLLKNPKYFMLSSYEIHVTNLYSQWAIAYPQEKNFTIVQAYFADAARTQPMVIIYEIPEGFDPNKEEITPSSKDILKSTTNKTSNNFTS